MKNKEFILIFGIIFLIGVILISFISAEMLISPANVSYDSNILEQFKNSTEVNVFFELNNFSDADNILANFSANEIKHIIKHDISGSISGEITQEGFNKLINNSRVSIVYYNAPVEGTFCGDKICNNEENCTTCLADCGECNAIVFPINSLWFWITISVVIILAIIGIFLLKRRNK